MREILYLDTDFLHSFLAQTNGGLPTDYTNEFEESSFENLEQMQGHQSKNFTELEGKSGKFSIPTIVETPEGGIKLHFEPGKYSAEKTFWQESDVGRELISKKLHDNSLIEFERYLEENSSLTQLTVIDDEKGYVLIESSFELIDLNTFEIAFSEGMVDMQVKEMKSLKDNELTEINQDSKLTSKEQKQQRDEVNKIFNAESKKVSEEFTEYREILGMLKKFMPSNVFIKTTNAIAPLKENFLRENRNMMLFKYGNRYDGAKVKVLAKITRKLEKKGEPNSFNEKDAIRESIEVFKGATDEMLIEHLNLVQNGDFVVNPIAVYFE
ncbi:hypothetical protein [Halobacillus sp. KGW1]|uniref:DUF6414 family protein n=1 Tax=Halobacillus sp. KGW1 TaxID=1793726 RepID=UPI000782A344|nr:hypothetical protein [Halobacillus sp. KGW1]